MNLVLLDRSQPNRSSEPRHDLPADPVLTFAQIDMLQRCCRKPKAAPRGGLLLSCYLREILAPAVGIEPTTN